MTNEEVNLQTKKNQYETNTKTPDRETTSTSNTANVPLHLPPPAGPHLPIKRLANNTTARAAVNYSIINDLAQSPMTMSALEVLKTCPTQRKSLLDTLDAVDPSKSKLITFDLDQGEPRMPSTIAFQILVSIWNLVVHRCIIDEGEST